MANLTEIKGDLLESKSQYIVHQSNCVTKRAKHLALSVFKKFPYADIYKPRAEGKYKDKPGSIIIKGNGADQRYVLAILGQFYPGKSKYGNDSPNMRLMWFKQGLKKIEKIEGLTSIAFPARIGCGAAGGDWKLYKKSIMDLAKKLPHVQFEIISLTGG